MTFIQMFNNALELNDKAGSPYFPPSNFDIYFNNKYNDWVEMMGKAIEGDERLMADIMYLYGAFQKANSSIVDRVIDVPNFRRRMRFNATFNDPCKVDSNGKPLQFTRNIRPVVNATIDEIQNDPLNKGIDQDPCAVATPLPSGNPGWQILSETVPVVVNMTYLKIPQVMNSQGTPNATFEGYDYVGNYIIRAVVYNWDITIENYNRFKAEKQDLAEVLS